MKRKTYRRLSLISQWCLVGSFGLVIIWNLTNLFYEVGVNMWWLAIVIPLPGLLSWIGLQFAPKLLTRSTQTHSHTYRLLYSTPQDWTDDRARRALLTLIQSGTGLDIFWVKDGEEVGCWLSVARHGPVLERLVRDVFPNGSLEVATLPQVGQGVAVLCWQKMSVDILSPSKLCLQDGIDGVYFRWCSETAATMALWGPKVRDMLSQFVDTDDQFFGQGHTLLAPPFVGDNPWPELPPFPPSEGYAGLSAISSLERLAPALRTNDTSALVIGQDVEQQLVGFTLPDFGRHANAAN